MAPALQANGPWIVCRHTSAVRQARKIGFPEAETHQARPCAPSAARARANNRPARDFVASEAYRHERVRLFFSRARAKKRLDNGLADLRFRVKKRPVLTFHYAATG